MVYSIKNKQKERGFTLIEMLVSVAIFAIIVAIISNSFIFGAKAHKYSLIRQEVINEVNYAMERISRSAIMAKKDTTGTCIASNSNYESDNGTYIKFKDYNGDCRQYYIESGTLKERVNNEDPGDLTSPNVNVLNFKIVLGGELQIDDLQPRVTILLEVEGVSPNPENKPKLKLQTTVSQRDPDIQI